MADTALQDPSTDVSNIIFLFITYIYYICFFFFWIELNWMSNTCMYVFIEKKKKKLLLESTKLQEFLLYKFNENSYQLDFKIRS